jgi:hypothetical protein
MVYDWKMGTSQVQQILGHVSHAKEEIFENLTSNAKENNYES